MSLYSSAAACLQLSFLATMHDVTRHTTVTIHEPRLSSLFCQRATTSSTNSRQVEYLRENRDCFDEVLGPSLDVSIPLRPKNGQHEPRPNPIAYNHW